MFLLPRIYLIAIILLIVACDRPKQDAKSERFGRNIDLVDKGAVAQERFYGLGKAANSSFESGDYKEAKRLATELLNLAPEFRDNWNYGNAIHDGNSILGRIAIKEGHVTEAKSYLIKAGNSPGSSQLDTYGPDLKLANDLLRAGESEVVAEYLVLCGKFWKTGSSQLKIWEDEIKSGKIPDDFRTTSE